MTKPKQIRALELDKLRDMTLAELETRLTKIEHLPQQTDETRQSARDVRVAIRTRQKLTKSKAILFEETNNHHLLFFESTCGFWKMAGRSVIIYSQVIAERIGQRYRIVQDKDTYSVSHDGIISFRNFELVQQRLLELGLERDEKYDRPGMIFFRLKKVYTDEKIENLRDKASIDRKWLEEMLLPKSPLPALYDTALKLNKLLYHNVRMMSDRFVKQTLGEPLIVRSGKIIQIYYRYANLKTASEKRRLALRDQLAGRQRQMEILMNETAAEYLLEIWETAIEIRDRLGMAENLKIIHWRALSEAITLAEKIEKMARRAAKE